MLKEHESDLQLILKVAFLHHRGKAQKEIAKQLNLTPSKVSRLLGKTKDFVELRYNVPGSAELEAKIADKFCLLDAVVVETGTPDQETAVVGQAAARKFLAGVSSGDSVALSCGETLLEMLKALPTQPALHLTISQLSVESDATAIHQSPATLVGLLRAKCSAKSDAFGLQLPPLGVVDSEKQFREDFRKSDAVKRLHRRVMGANCIFIGIGNPCSYSGSFHRIAEEATHRRFREYIRKFNLVGEINNRVYDGDGRDRTDEVSGLNDRIISVITLADLRRLAKDRVHHRVVAVATGIQKAHAIRVALQAGFANVLVVGRDTAERLL